MRMTKFHGTNIECTSEEDAIVLIPCDQSFNSEPVQ